MSVVQHFVRRPPVLSGVLVATRSWLRLAGSWNQSDLNDTNRCHMKG
jgi:hypothetical protein